MLSTFLWYMKDWSWRATGLQNDKIFVKAFNESACVRLLTNGEIEAQGAEMACQGNQTDQSQECS